MLPPLTNNKFIADLGNKAPKPIYGSWLIPEFKNEVRAGYQLWDAKSRSRSTKRESGASRKKETAGRKPDLNDVRVLKLRERKPNTKVLNEETARSLSLRNSLIDHQMEQQYIQPSISAESLPKTRATKKPFLQIRQYQSQIHDNHDSPTKSHYTTTDHFLSSPAHLPHKSSVSTAISKSFYDYSASPSRTLKMASTKNIQETNQTAELSPVLTMLKNGGRRSKRRGRR